MKLGVVGCGAMGQIVKKVACEEFKDVISEVYMIEPIQVKDREDELPSDFDLIIDFSSPYALATLLKLVKIQRKKPVVVIATTGYTENDQVQIEELSKTVAVVKSSNFSYGINILNELAEICSNRVPCSCDVEIVEKHHRYKKDAPSGTAKTLVRYLKASNQDGNIPIHSVRGGTVPGEHTCIFAMDDEVIEIKHIAYSKAIFARGAIKAAISMKNAKAGLYGDESFAAGQLEEKKRGNRIKV